MIQTGFRREQLRERYDVDDFHEDPWHGYCGECTREIISGVLPNASSDSDLLLNAGSGVYRLNRPGWEEISVDLFESPLGNRPNSLCASVEDMPLEDESFGAVVCVGEVLGYCDPQRAFIEFSRVLRRGGILICDFGSTLSFRHRSHACYAREADIIVDEYNGTEERVWVYNPHFIRRLLRSSGFTVQQEFGTHTWSALANRLGVSKARATTFQRSMRWLSLPRQWADIRTIVAERA